MRVLRLPTAALLVLGVNLANAGNSVGNGGDAVVCSQNPSVALLDFYEAGLSSSAQPEPAPGALSESTALAKRKLEGLARLHPRLGGQLRKRLEELPSEIELREGVALVDVSDSAHLVVPADPRCKLQQLAIRRELQLAGEKKFLVDGTLWRQLPGDHRAGLLVHEVLYEYLSKLGETDSRKARLLNAKIFSGAFETMKEAEYWKLIRELRLPIYPGA